MSVTLPETFLFEAFSKFLSKLEKFESKKEYFRGLLIKQEIEPTRVSTFNCYVGQSLLNGLGAESVANHFSGKPIADERFNFFCEKFEKLFSDLIPEEKIRYEAIGIAFIQWRNQIYNRLGIDPVFKNDISLSGQQSSDINSESLGKLDQDSVLTLINEESFKKALETILNYYEQRSEEQFNEKYLFHVFRKFIDQRTQYNKLPIGVYNFDDLRTNLIYNFTRNAWDIYELDVEKICKSSISFGYGREEKVTFEKYGFHCMGERLDKDETLIYGFSFFDIIHRCISLEDDSKAKEGVFAYITLSYEDGKYDPDICFGHKLIVNREHMNIRIFPVLMAANKTFDKKKDVSAPEKYDFYDSIIPEHIRAFLLSPSKIETKPNRFLYKEITFKDIEKFINPKY